MSVSRREFVGGLAAVAASSTLSAQMKKAAATCPFHLAVINDEISQDFDHACSVAANDFGLSWIELRSMWGKNITELDEKQIADAKKILAKYKLRVTDIASPLFKTDLPGAPRSKESPQRDQFKANFDYKEQDALLVHCIKLAKAFETNKIRCFDFWRLDDQKPYRAEINRKLKEAAEECGRHNMLLVLENEMACNTGSGEEALEVLNAIPTKSFTLNWDPGNAVTFPNNVPYPDAYDKLPKHRIVHCHAKSAIRLPNGKHEWKPVGEGLVDWVGQLGALKRDGYKGAVSLETHWRGAGSAEASTRISMKGLKDCAAKAGLNCA
ncbi:MAG: sugar phosphate isomerase/epimerase [Acidobacteria bacterium]|nr:sugar phosphate isomerase/epimerase [Acidobacteriota bacterium]